MFKKQNIKIKSAVFCLLTLLWMTVIFMFSAKNADDSTEQSSFVTNILMNIFSNVYRNSDLSDKMQIIESMSFAIRKAAHFSIYSVLGLLSFLSVYYLTKFSNKTPFISLLICFIYACSDETHQLFVPGRSGQIRDIFIDFSGALLMTLIILAVRKIYRKIKNPA